MKITLEQALEIARKQKELGCCSQHGQAIVLLLDEIDRLKKDFLELAKLKEIRAMLPPDFKDRK